MSEKEKKQDTKKKNGVLNLSTLKRMEKLEEEIE